MIREGQKLPWLRRQKKEYLKEKYNLRGNMYENNFKSTCIFGNKINISLSNRSITVCPETWIYGLQFPKAIQIEQIQK